MFAFFLCPVRPFVFIYIYIYIYVCLLLVDLANLCLSLSVAKSLSDCVYVIMRECEVLCACAQLKSCACAYCLSSTCAHAPANLLKGGRRVGSRVLPCD